MKHFILMSDVINSSKKDSKLLMDHFKQVVSTINTKYKSDLPSPLTITLGDEFQGLISNLNIGLKIIIDLEEEILKQNFDFKLRHVLNYGDIETKINTDIAYEMLGKGLSDARYKLNDMKSESYRFFVNLEDQSKNKILNNTFVIYQNIVDKWDQDRDHELISTFIQLKDYKLVAEKLNKTRSQIWKREKTLNIDSYIAVKEILNAISQS